MYFTFMLKDIKSVHIFLYVCQLQAQLISTKCTNVFFSEYLPTLLYLRQEFISS